MPSPWWTCLIRTRPWASTGPIAAACATASPGSASRDSISTRAAAGDPGREEGRGIVEREQAGLDADPVAVPGRSANHTQLIKVRYQAEGTRDAVD
jgi:hypothetical protein